MCVCCYHVVVLIRTLCAVRLLCAVAVCLRRSVQMGRLPIYLYDDYLWLPYIGTNKSVETFGFAARLQEVPEVVRRIKEMTAEEFQRRLAKVHR